MACFWERYPQSSTTRKCSITTKMPWFHGPKAKREHEPQEIKPSSALASLFELLAKLAALKHLYCRQVSRQGETVSDLLYQPYQAISTEFSADTSCCILVWWGPQVFDWMLFEPAARFAQLPIFSTLTALPSSAKLRIFSPC